MGNPDYYFVSEVHSTCLLLIIILPKVPLANGLTNTRKNAFIPLAQHLNLMKPRKSGD